uniref:Uncharacterized protein n=1 Tax=Arundo donax TaxID=35708 RepID=A0A0A9AQL9_ARUDO
MTTTTTKTPHVSCLQRQKCIPKFAHAKS